MTLYASQHSSLESCHTLLWHYNNYTPIHSTNKHTLCQFSAPHSSKKKQKLTSKIIIYQNHPITLHFKLGISWKKTTQYNKKQYLNLSFNSIISSLFHNHLPFTPVCYSICCFVVSPWRSSIKVSTHWIMGNRQTHHQQFLGHFPALVVLFLFSPEMNIKWFTLTKHIFPRMQ